MKNAAIHRRSRRRCRSARIAAFDVLAALDVRAGCQHRKVANRNRLVVPIALALAGGGAGAIALARPLATPAKLSPPVIHEMFTPLPCGGKPANRTTLQQLGCAEQAILRTDKELDSVAKSIFSRVRDDPARGRFLAAAEAWLTYRNADCASRSDVFEGGTQAPVLAAQCMAAHNRTRLSNLRTFARDLPH
jgi:uncharacterized protein YecT (DUF1311 family)